MKFSIITPTYRRSDLLVRAVSSLISQTYKDWEIIIVNDSPDDSSYANFTSSINDPRIHYHTNTTNRGVNFSRNHALDKVSADSTWILFLDDDDYLAPDALQTFHDLILTHPNQKWFVTNRAYKNGETITRFPHSEKFYNYAWQYLILKRLKGDATHCIETKYVTKLHAQFSKHVKQGEEWFFFFQIGLHSKMYYYDHNSTISDGYNTSTGLNFRKRSLQNRYESIVQLFYEGFSLMIIRPSFLIYIIARLVTLIIKK